MNEQDEYLCEITGTNSAKEDAEKYRSDEITYEDIKNYCEFARLSALCGDITGYYYLKQMEREGLIKNLHVED